MTANTLFLRLEGPLQSWGDHLSRFVIRGTAGEPTKSGVIGLLCAALGVPRSEAAQSWLPKLSALRMGVRVDRPGVRWWDYHTVGAGVRMRKADGRGEGKLVTLLSRREYLCDASFLVALQGDGELVSQLYNAVLNPHWTLYLGRKCCPPSRPLAEPEPGCYPDLLAALASVPWRPRTKDDTCPGTLDCLLEWNPSAEGDQIPEDAVICYDVPKTLAPPAHLPRIVVRSSLRPGPDGEVQKSPPPGETELERAPRPRADYTNSQYRIARAARLAADHSLCVFCKAPAETVQHITYRRAGGKELPEDLRSLCRLCHDAVTMLEYHLGMGLDRVNPEDPRWRPEILRRRRQIVECRSLETRRRRLAGEEA